MHSALGPGLGRRVGHVVLMLAGDLVGRGLGGDRGACLSGVVGRGPVWSTLSGSRARVVRGGVLGVHGWSCQTGLVAGSRPISHAILVQAILFGGFRGSQVKLPDRSGHGALSDFSCDFLFKRSGREVVCRTVLSAVSVVAPCNTAILALPVWLSRPSSP